MVEGAAVLGALVLDAALGWPEGLYRRIGHPVGAFAQVISGLERRWNREALSFAARRLRGVAAMIVLPVMVGGAAWGVETVAGRLAGSWSWLVIALVAWPALAQRSLYDHIVPVRRALAARDLPAARLAVGRIVGRDTRELDEAGVARAGIESLAESFCDGVIAPLFWFVVAGLPGLWVYKAINTADSLIGHPEEPLRAYGWAAARIDDLANFVPARLSGVLICLAGAGGWRILWRDHARHASPNAGWSEAAMAGALGLRLAGPVHYDGVRADKPWIGDEGRPADAPAMRKAEGIYLRACLLAWLACALATGGRTWLG
ncbi:MAG: adenosylcobinamide-phosphate synthase CbiB [Pseudomonadota bacterium]|nr:adenosylcobinamide-phosphate synthase CbiB [Pseudomonadota bacterium]